ncbi:hypothetical protein PS619_01901 [Pseudomonas fluorescens]|nr:hypothetical protein PS619_01901 [Pseudomonas fluorescens]
MQGNQQDKDVLRGWCAFVEATGLAKSRIQDVEHEQEIRLQGKDIEEDASGFFISLSSVQSEALRVRFAKRDEEGRLQTEPLQIGFPLLRVIEGSKSFFVPLFRYSVPDHCLSTPALHLCVPVKKGAEVVPNIAAFRQYLDIDIEELGAERHMMSLAAACSGKQGEDFVSVFRTFLAWVNHRLAGLKPDRADLSDIFLEKHITALVCPEVNTDFNSREQLKDYKILLERPDVRTPSLLQQYILQRTLTTAATLEFTRFPYGLFERKYPLGRGQMATLTQVSSGAPLVAVQGAPGTGKTTLFKSLIASQLVERALACIGGADCNLGLVVTSTAKKAVENVIDDFRDDPSLKDLKWLYFLGGDKNQITDEVERVNALLVQLNEQTYDKTRQGSLANRITAIRQLIDGVFARFLVLTRTLDQATAALAAPSPEVFQARLETLKREVVEKGIALKMPAAREQPAELSVLSAQCKHALGEVAAHKNRHAQAMECLSRHYSRLIDAPFAETAYQAWLASTLSETLEHHYADYPTGLFAPLLAWIQRSKYTRARSHLQRSFSDEFSRYQLASLSDVQFAELARNRRALYQLGTTQETLEILRLGLPDTAHEEQIKALVMAIEQLVQRTRDWASYNKAHHDLHSEFPEGDWVEVLRKRFIAQQREIFESAVDYLWQELLRQKAALAQVLPLWCNLLNGQLDSGFYKWKDKLDEFYRLVSLAYPVMASTLASVQKLAGYKLGDLNGFAPYALSLVDEAGMISAESLVPLLARSQRAIVVGDPMQIEPIRGLGKATADKLKAHYFADNTLYEAVSPMLVTAYHRAAGTLSGAVTDMGNGIVLDEHRRCQPAIAELFMQIAGYRGVQVCTSAPEARIGAACDSMGGFNLMFYGVQGRRGAMPNTNQDEVEAIGLLLDKLEAAGYDLTKDVGIITPYSNQKNLLIKAYGQRMKQSQALKIGSVHQFQGVGFEVIIYSPVIFQRTDRDNFQNGKPNLLNVAVSRAKQQFIVVGNQQRLLAAGKSLKKMAEVCSASFFVSMEHQSPTYASVNANGVKHYFDCDHISAFDTLLSASQRSFTVVVPWIRQGINRNHPPLKLLRTAQERGIKVTVYYGYDGLGQKNADDGDAGLIIAYQRELGAESVVRLPEGTHEKILLVDDQVATVGSWNWLSHSYYQYCATTTHRSLALRRETSVELRDPALISALKQRLGQA